MREGHGSSNGGALQTRVEKFFQKKALITGCRETTPMNKSETWRCLVSDTSCAVSGFDVSGNGAPKSSLVLRSC
jgi:hypothetical protein